MTQGLLFEKIALEKLRILLDEGEKATKPSGTILTPVLSKQGVEMRLTTHDDFSVMFMGGRFFGWTEIAALQPAQVAEAMRHAVNDLYRKMNRTTE